MVVASAHPGIGNAVVVRVAGHRLALPIEHVIETMRPLPIDPSADPPTAQIRGAPCRVVQLATLVELPAPDAPSQGELATRYLVVRTSSGPVALQVDAVLEVRAIDRREPVRKLAMRSSHPRDMLTSERLDPLREVLATAAWLSPPEVHALTSALEVE